jgi:hypothetical protein
MSQALRLESGGVCWRWKVGSDERVSQDCSLAGRNESVFVLRTERDPTRKIEDVELIEDLAVLGQAEQVVGDGDTDGICDDRMKTDK